MAWKPVWWAPVLAGEQAQLLRDMRRDNDLDQRKLRNFVVNALGDAVAYRKLSETNSSQKGVYEEVHDIVRESMRALRAATREGKPEDAPEAPLVVIAHSLGCHVMSNYIWDLQKDGASSLGNDFEDMKTLSGLLTFGCNIPLFTLAHSQVEPICFPLDVSAYFPEGTSQSKLRTATRWRNYYDPDDILGWPLKPLSASYKKAVHEDVDINVGGFFSSWNPASHGQYWTDNSFTKPAASALAQLLKLL